MNPIDASYIAVMIFAIITGFRTGVVGTLLLLAQVILGVFLFTRAGKLVASASRAIQNVGLEETPLLSFILILLGIAMVFLFIRLLTERYVRSGIRVVSGQFVGILVWVFLFTWGFGLVMNLMSDVISYEQIASSRVYEFTTEFANVMMCQLSGTEDFWAAMGNSFKDLAYEIFNIGAGDCAPDYGPE